MVKSLTNFPFKLVDLIAGLPNFSVVVNGTLPHLIPQLSNFLNSQHSNSDRNTKKIPKKMPQMYTCVSCDKNAILEIKSNSLNVTSDKN